MTAKAVGVSINYISKLEKEENSNPSDDIIINLANILGIDEDSLFNFFGKIPLSTRRVLEKYPALSKFISMLSYKEIGYEKIDGFLNEMISQLKLLYED